MMISKTNITDLKFDIGQIQSNQTKLGLFLITVPSYLVNKLYKQAVISQKNEISTHGFQKNNVPIAYIEKNFKLNIIEHLKEFILKYFVISFLYNELKKNKIVIAGEPRLNKINLDLENDAEYYFEFTPTTKINLEDWKFLPFKSPKRKNYKDLDKQATAFIKEETYKVKKNEAVEIGDWVCFDIYPVDDNKNQIFGDFKDNLWLQIGDDEPCIPFQELFLNKKQGDKFYSNSHCLQSYFDNQINSYYNFFIDIKDVLSKYSFSIDYLKEHFKLKSNKSIHQKLIEVFSFRNDLSLRRAIVEELFDLFFSRIQFEVPAPAVLRQQKILLDLVQTNPDYPVYKMQKEFDEKIKMLAHKQIKEMILIDYLTHFEEIDSMHQDIKYYLNLANRPRTKEFIYFQHPIIKANEQEYPIQSEVLKQYCLREKTLNHAINYLTRM